MGIPIEALSAFFESQRVLGPTISKLPGGQDDEDTGIVAHFLGIPVGFQFGTAMGLKGIPALITDIVTDPTTYLLGGLGSLTKFGEGARAVGKIAKLRFLDETLQGLKGTSLGEAVGKLAMARAVTPSQKAEMIFSSVKRSAALSTTAYEDVLKGIKGLDPESAQEILSNAIKDRTGQFVVPVSDLMRARSAVAQGGTEAGEAFLQGNIARRHSLRQAALDASQAIQAGQPYGWTQFSKTAKEMQALAVDPRYDKMFGSGARGRMKALFEEFERTGKPVAALAPDAISQAAMTIDGMSAPQRALISVRLPFVGEKIISVGATMVGKGAALIAPLAKILPQSHGLISRASQVSQKLAKANDAPRILANADSVRDVMGGAFDSIAKAATFSKDSPDLLPEARDLLSNGEVLLRAQRQTAAAFGDLIPREIDSAIRAGGLNKENVWRLTEMPEQHLRVPDIGAAKAQTRFGNTHVFGELTEDSVKAGYKQAEVELAQSITAAFDYGKQVLQQAKVLGSFIHDYAHRIITPAKGSAETVGEAVRAIQRRVTTTTFASPLQKRSGLSMPELLNLEKAGKLTIEKDPARLAQHYFSSMGRVLADGNFMKQAASWRVPFVASAGPMGAFDIDMALPLLLPGSGVNWAKPYLKAAADQYANVVDPYLVAFGRQMGLVSDTKGFRASDSVYVHKDIVGMLRTILKPGIANDISGAKTLHENAFTAALAVGSIAKRSLLAPGSMHYVFLNAKVAAVAGWEGLQQSWKATKNAVRGGSDIHPLMPMMQSFDRWSQLGLVMRPSSDAEMDMFQKAMAWTAKTLPITKPLVAAMQFGEAQITRKLFDLWQNPMKLWTAETLYSKGLERFASKMPAEQIGRSTADFVNQVYGGGVLERMIKSEGGKQWLRLMLLAPDWTLSNIALASDVFANWFKKQEWFQRGVGRMGWVITPEDVLKSDVRAFYARQYVLRSGMMMYGAANLANLAFSGHFIWDNKEGHKDQVEMPWKDSNNRSLYMDMFKALSEPFEMAANPTKFLNYKLGYIPHQAMAVVTGKDMFGVPIVGAEDGPFVSLVKKVGYGIQGAMPIGLSQLAGIGSGTKDLATRAMIFAGAPMKTEFANQHQAEDATSLEQHPMKTKQQLRAEIHQEMQDAINKEADKLGTIYDARMKDPAYRRALAMAQDASVSPQQLPVTPPNALLAVP